MTPRMAELREMLERLDRFLIEQGAPVSEALRPGLTGRDLDAAEAELGFPLPQEVREWYTWHDGIDIFAVEDDDVYLPNGLLLCSMRDAIKGRHEFLNPGFKPLDTYPPTWLPITKKLKNTLVVDCAGAARHRSAPAPVHFLNYEDIWDLVQPSITDMVRVWMVMIDEGYWRYDHDEEEWEDTYARIPLEHRRSRVV